MQTKSFQIIFKEIGNLISLLGLILLVPAAVGVLYSEWYSVLGFLLAASISIILGQGTHFIFRKALEPQYKHGYIIAALGWLIMTMMGGLPLYIIAFITPAEIMQSLIPAGMDYTSSLLYFRNPLHCLFESMSAYTTTGLTMAVHEPSVGKTVLFYRSFAQWIGGAGFIVMALAMIKHGSGRSLKLLYRSESTGINLRTKVMDTARDIWKSYAIITGITVVYLIIGTWIILPEYPIVDNIFDAFNHAMAGLSSGGFSTLDDSIAGYQSEAMDYLLLLPMIFGSFSLPFYFRIFYKGQISEIWRDVQTRSLLWCFLFGSIILSLLLMYSGVVPNPFREGIFQYISAISTTGWQTSNIHVWDDKSFLFIIFGAMFIGGAWGGTVGGIKIYRAVFIQKGIRWHIKKSFFSPNTIRTMKFDGKTMLPDEINSELASASIFTIMFFLILIGSTFVTTFFIPEQYSFFDALFEATAAQSTAGLSVGITEPGMNSIVEIIYIFQMWVGRLEIFPVLALCRYAFMGGNPKLN
ncbi:MAG TPA: potassium transporter TrkG [Paludibacter sp.]|nr:potassium transporter TrkG [Paludibacter sp.]